MKNKQFGFSLIELVVSLVIMGILLTLGIPQFSNYMRDTRLRAIAETFLSGIQLARTEAVRRNTRVEFLLTAADPTLANLTADPAAEGPNWMIRTFDQAVFIEGKFAETGNGATISNSGTVASITFDGLGQANPATQADFDFESTQAACQNDGPVRCLRVRVSALGEARLCDPRADAQDTRSCND